MKGILVVVLLCVLSACAYHGDPARSHRNMALMGYGIQLMDRNEAPSLVCRPVGINTVCEYR